MTSHNMPMTMRERWKQRLAITLYEHGHSAPSVGELLDMPTWEVSRIVTKAGVGRTRSEAAQITKSVDRRQVQQVRRLADIAGAMAAKINLSADLLLDVLAYRLSATSAPIATPKAAEPQPATKTSSPPNRKGRNSPTCVNVCDFACTHHCAKTVSDNITPRQAKG